MAPATRTITSTSNNEDGDVGARLRSVEASLAQVTTALQEMNHMLNGNGRYQNQNQFTRMTKVDFPKFSGDDVKGWIFTCDQFFSIDEIPENQKVKLISVHLFDTALLWHRQFIRLNGEAVSWDVYKKELHRVDVSKEHAVSFYLGGLPAEIEMGVRMFRPTTLADAYQLTNYQEATLETMRKKNKVMVNSQQGRVGGGCNSYGSNVKPSLLPLPSSNSNWRNKPKTPIVNPIRKQMTQKEYQEKRVLLADEELEGEEEYIEEEGLMSEEDKEFEGTTNAELLMFCVYLNTGVNLLNMEGQTKENGVDPELSVVVDTFADVFEVPKKLPSKRSHDHRIPLLPNTQPVNIRPYRHPPMHKDAIKVMVKELLDSGVIKPSNGPFASLIVMVKKKNNTWRMCVDYRQLNKHTVKDKFLIPIIKELIEELHGATIFSKLDLRSGYHQIRMHKEDIHKTAFKTHQGHYEFLVMPFGSTNAPSTFQALMNEVFQPFLRKFTLVFFDDILIYSKSLEDHVQHLSAVLDTMRQNELFAKKISRPLTQLLKNGGYKWSDEAQAAFETLKSAMQKAPVLALPDFTNPFEVETDASGVGIGVVL
ncbi:putative mitochondrial protein [Tanacetum coccineum]